MLLEIHPGRVVVILFYPVQITARNALEDGNQMGSPIGIGNHATLAMHILVALLELTTLYLLPS